jgi:hypothetical protein
MQEDFSYTDTGFLLVLNGKLREIAWADIESVFAYKLDRFTVDDVCLDLILKESVITLNEEMQGWTGFVDRLGTNLPGLKDYWIVIHPPFALNLTLLYDRYGRDQGEVENLCYRN